MSTYTTSYTYAHTVTYMTDKLLQSLLKIISLSGLSPNKLTVEWQSLSNAIQIWIHSGHFEAAVLEVYNPSNSSALIGRWDLDLSYDHDEAEMWTDIDAIKYAIARRGMYPSSCSYRIIVFNKDGSPDVHGWGPTTFRSTEGLSRVSIGTAIGAGSLGSSVSYWR